MPIMGLLLAALTVADGGPVVQVALRNAEGAQRALAASRLFVDGWLALKDAETGLLPQRLDSPVWTVENSAADCYPFMVLTSFFTDPAMLSGEMRDILEREMRLTTRVRSLPDALDLTRDAFAHAQADSGRIVFGASEYCKDGLLPVAEVMGPSPWFERLRAMARDICAESRVETAYGPIPSRTAEVNGNMLQVLCRLHSATGDPLFLEHALRIADAYFLDALPKGGGLPCHEWDFAAGKPVNAVLNLVDHGSEILGGLSEAFVAARTYAPDRAAQYEPALRRMLDTLLERSRNRNGILSMRPEGTEGVPDTWGYVYNAFYTAYLLLGEPRYRDAVLEAMDHIVAYTDWGGADAYADCEEGTLVLLNREWRPDTARWLDSLVAKHLSMQRPDGILEGWYGDGNSARTWLMWAQMKTAGTRLSPWRGDLRYGAARDAESLVVVAEAEREWRGTLTFDKPRHRDHMGLPLNYPRLNEWPEWWPVDSGALYRVETDDGSRTLAGFRLTEGLPVHLAAGERWVARVTPVSTYPHGLSTLAIVAPRFAMAGAECTADLAISNSGSRSLNVLLSASAGDLVLRRLTLGPGAQQVVRWRGRGLPAGTVRVTARSEDVALPASATIEVVDQPGLLDMVAFGDQEYQGTGYQWLGRQEIRVGLRTAGRRELLLRMLWGAKNDQRRARLKAGPVDTVLASGGYDGFRWLEMPVVLSEPVDELAVELRREGDGSHAFVSQIQLVDPAVAGGAAREAARQRRVSDTWSASPKVLMIVHDPRIPSRGNRPLHEAFGWNDSDSLARQYIADVREASGGLVRYEIAKRVVVDGFPTKADGFRYDADSYVRAWDDRTFHEPDGVDYRALIREFGVVDLVERGAIDEVWLFGAPYFGYYESLMVGDGAYWCNSPPLEGVRCRKRFVVMGFSYERGVGEMLEDLGHRAESIMAHVYGSWDADEAHAWNRFTLHDRALPGKASCGNVHFAPNSPGDYQWGDRRFVLSTCDHWYGYPEPPGPPRWVNCEEWGNGDIRAHHKWWFDHLPRAAGRTDGMWNNWWRYVIDLNGPE